MQGSASGCNLTQLMQFVLRVLLVGLRTAQLIEKKSKLWLGLSAIIRSQRVWLNICDTRAQNQSYVAGVYL